jgi:hypothetical protein
MRILRAILVLLLSIAVPYSATATLLQDLPCHRDGGAASLHASALAHTHPADHAMHASAHSPAAVKSAQGCDCAVKCECRHHCATVNAVASTQSRLDPPIDASASVTAVLAPAFVPDAQTQDLLRPPIAALA